MSVRFPGIYVVDHPLQGTVRRRSCGTGQCHQAKGFKLTPDGQWHDVTIETRAVVGGEHWGGANDGKWHGPATGLGINIVRESVGNGAEGTVWFDDVSYVLTTEPFGEATVLPCELQYESFRPGYGSTVTYRWDVEPMGRDFAVFDQHVGTIEALARARARDRAKAAADSALAAEIKKNRPDLPIVSGGPHVSTAPLTCLADPNLDAGVVGEGEATTPELFERLLAGTLADLHIPNLQFHTLPLLLKM